MGQIFAYARVSTDAQDLDPQTDELRKDGFDVLVVEKASGASRTRPELPGIDSLIVSDASAYFLEDYGAATGVFTSRSPFLRAPRLYEIATEQTRSLRSRMLMDAVTGKRVNASIIRMGRSCAFIEKASGVPQHLPAEDVLSDAEIESLAAFPTNGGAIEPKTCTLIARHGFEAADATLYTYQKATFPGRMIWAAEPR